MRPCKRRHYKLDAGRNANATSAKMAKMNQVDRVAKMTTMAIMAKMTNQDATKAERNSAFNST